MISKELLSEVLGIKCNCYKEIGDDSIIYPLVHYGFVKGIEQVGNAKQYPKGINIYELAHKCKEWAIKKGYQFKVYYQADGTEEWEIGLAGYGWDLFRAKNCVEACQWILENK